MLMKFTAGRRRLRFSRKRKRQAIQLRTALPQRPKRPRVALLYRDADPDGPGFGFDFRALAEDLARYGWHVEAMPCRAPGPGPQKAKHAAKEAANRSPEPKRPRRYIEAMVHYTRIRCPKSRPAQGDGNFLRSLPMILAWTRLAFRKADERPDVVIIGPAPVSGIFAGYLIKRFSPGMRVAYWSLELQPEADILRGQASGKGPGAWLTRWAIRRGVRASDLIADTGPSMQLRLSEYDSRARSIQATPWARAEPDAPAKLHKDMRKALFGEARLGLLYQASPNDTSGCGIFLDLARRLRDAPGIHFCFAIDRVLAEALKSSLTVADTNISIVPPASGVLSEDQLAAADINMVCFRPEWRGISALEGFFSSLAVGRPVLLAGPPGSDAGRWLDEYQTGWHLRPDNIDSLAAMLRTYAKTPDRLTTIRRTCHDVYSDAFSRTVITGVWHDELSALIGSQWFHDSEPRWQRQTGGGPNLVLVRKNGRAV